MVVICQESSRTRSACRDGTTTYPTPPPSPWPSPAINPGGRLLGAQLAGHLGREISKRVDIYAATLLSETSVYQASDLDPSDTPPLGNPCDAVQVATQSWTGRPHGDTPRDS